jgi:hypothetical protein
MYLSKVDRHTISRAIFEIQMATEQAAQAESEEARNAGYARRYTAEKVLRDLGINCNFFEDSRKVSDKGFDQWWELRRKHSN